MNDIVGMKTIMENCRVFSDSAEGQLSSAWRKVVSKIKSVSETSDSDESSDKRIPLGERLACNTRVVDLKKGVLVVESDHPGWIQYIKFYQKFILKGLAMESPELEIKSLAFRLKEVKEEPLDVYKQALKKAREELWKKNEAREKEIEEFFSTSEQKPEKSEKTEPSKLPPELLSKIESIRQSLLTKDAE